MGTPRMLIGLNDEVQLRERREHSTPSVLDPMHELRDWSLAEQFTA